MRTALSTDSLWRMTGFRRFFSAQCLGIFGGQVSQLTLPTAAILMLHAGPLAVGFLNALQFMPYLFFGLVIGALTDHVSRRRLILLSAAGRTLVLASIPVAYLVHGLSLAHVYVAAALNGTLAVVFTVACQAYLPDLVERSHLVDANLRLQVSRSAVEVSAPAVSGLLIQVVGAADAILADALSHLASMLATARIPRSPERVTAATQRRGGLGGEIREGVAIVLKDGVIRSITASGTTLNFGYYMAQTVLLLFAYRELGLTPGAVGSLLGLGSLGFVLGAAVAPRLSGRLGLGPTLGLSCFLIGLGVTLAPVALLGLAGPVLVASQFLVSMQWPIYNANQIALRQQRTPPELQGRVSATVRTVGLGVIPVASVLAGLLGVRLGLAATIALGGVVAASGSLWLLRRDVFRLRQLPPSPLAAPLDRDCRAAQPPSYLPPQGGEDQSR